MIDYNYVEGKNISEFFGKLYEILSLLRSPEGCPWDRKETPQSVVSNLKSEIFEALDEILQDNKNGIIEEVGDILLNAIMLLVVLRDTKEIEPEHIIDQVCRKLISRHPHVFTNEIHATTSDEALDVWNQAKKKEGKSEKKDDFFSRIPKSCETFSRAGEVLRKAIGAGFTWEKDDDVLKQASSEIEEIRQELESKFKDEAKIKMEIGDAIFSAMAISQYKNYDPEICLRLALEKFEKRFNVMRQVADKDGIVIKKGSKNSLDILDKYWKKAKELVDEKTFT